MSRSRKAAAPPPPETMESKLALIRDVVATHCAPRLLERKWQKVNGRSFHGPSLVGWTFAATQNAPACLEGAYLLTFLPRHQVAMFRQEPRPSETSFTCLSSVTREAVINALFHALSWPGSPYWWDGKWDRKTTLYG